VLETPVLVRSVKLSSAAPGQVLDGRPLHTSPVLFGREVGGIEDSATASLALIINLSPAWNREGILLLFELYRPSEGTLSRWSQWSLSTGVGYVPVFSSSLLVQVRLIVICIITHSFTDGIRPVSQGSLSKQCVVEQQ
jgi:hypothetical protein